MKTLKTNVIFTVVLSLTSTSFAGGRAGNNGEPKELTRAQVVAQNEKVREQVSRIDIRDLSLEELQMSLSEIQQKVALLKEDLKSATPHEGRRAVKFRNYAALTSLGMVVMMQILPRLSNTGYGTYLAAYFLTVASIGTTVAAQSYILLTEDEVTSITNTIGHLEAKMASIQEKIDQRK